MFNGEKFGKEIVEIVKSYVARQIEPLEERLNALEVEAGISKAKPVVRAKAIGRPQ